MPPPTPQVTHGIRLEHLTKRYGEKLAVDDVSLQVAPGEVVALLGPNGAGKSTTIDMLLGLTPPDAGAVELWGLDPAEACRRGMVGAMLQSGGLLGGVTVAEMIGLVRRLSPHPLAPDEVYEMARVTELTDTRADRLSGGEVQRVRFALAIAGNPHLLVLDEPTVAMDVATRRSFWEAMYEWTSSGRTVLFATHYLEEADQYADRAVLMAQGRVVADGAVAEVKAAVGLRVIRVTVEASIEQLSSLVGVVDAERRGDVATLRCHDSDAALRHLLRTFPNAHDIEVRGAGLEEAFLALTADTRQPASIGDSQ